MQRMGVESLSMRLDEQNIQMLQFVINMAIHRLNNDKFFKNMNVYYLNEDGPWENLLLAHVL